MCAVDLRRTAESCPDVGLCEWAVRPCSLAQASPVQDLDQLAVLEIAVPFPQEHLFHLWIQDSKDTRSFVVFFPKSELEVVWVRDKIIGHMLWDNTLFDAHARKHAK